MSLTPSGLQIKRLPEILADMIASAQADIDPNISTAPDSVFGNLFNIMSERYASLYALTQAVYDASNIDKAEGKQLNDLAALRGVTRIAASKSNTDRQQFIGNNGTLIPAGSLFANPISGDRFTNTADITLDALNCLSADLSVQNVINNEDYEITVSGTTYTYTSDGDATATEIVNGIKAEIDADAGAAWTVTVNGTTLTITSNDTTKISISVITFISVDKVTTEGYIEAVETGNIIAPPNSVTQIVTVIPGLDSTTNVIQLILGRSEETDEQLRTRIATTGGADCTGTIPSIEAAIVDNVVGVTSARVTENTTAYNLFNISSVVGAFVAGEEVVGGTSGATGYVVSITDAENIVVWARGTFTPTETITGNTSAATATLDRDFPPNAYETVVVGGDNTEVGQEIWRTKPAGIATYGNISQVIVDSNGNNRTVLFTRPTAVNFAIQVTYSLYDEEIFPVSGEDLMEDAILEHVNNLGVDVDLIPGRLFGPIYNSAAGIEELTVEIQTITNPGDAPNPGSWQTTTIAVDGNEFASTTGVDIYFVQV